MRTHIVARSAITGRFITLEESGRNQATTMIQTIEYPSRTTPARRRRTVSVK